MSETSFVEIVDLKLRDVLAGPAAELGVSLQDLGLRVGKRARPKLVHACAESLGLAPERAAAWAALVEMIHVASLVHDDVIDGALLRRGQPTLRARDGNRRAVLGGDLFVSAAWLVACQELTPEVTAILARAMLAMTPAELRERELLWNPHARLSTYLAVIDGKTAALFAAAAEGVAALAGASLEARRALTRCAGALGRAFQIQDDVRDYEPAGGGAGKDTMKDLAEGLVTLPLIVALRRDDPRAADVRRFLVSCGDGALASETVTGLLADSRALERSLRLARRTVRRGLCALDEVVPARAIAAVTTSMLGWSAPPLPC